MAPLVIQDSPVAEFNRTKKKSVVAKPTEGHSHGHELVAQMPLKALSHGKDKLAGVAKFSNLALMCQWQLDHMAAAFRHWAREGYVGGMGGHISVRDPEFPNTFWTNPLGVHFGLLKASEMMFVDFNGDVVGDNTSRPPNSAGFLIHAAVHAAREDVHAIYHCHSISGNAWSIFERPIEMLTQDSTKVFGEAQAVYTAYRSVVLGREEGERIATALGPKGKGAILQNHGILTVAQTVDEAVFLFTSLEKSCQVQLLAEAAAANGIPKVIISDEEAQFNFDVKSDPEVCFVEFQVYCDWQMFHTGGAFKE